jgi:hypothetical protein
MAKLTDLLTTTPIRRSRYRTELPGFGVFHGTTATQAQTAAVTAYVSFHQQQDHRKRAVISCADGRTLMLCFAVADGWAYRLIELDKTDPSYSGGCRISEARVSRREGDRRTWEEFLTACAAFAAAHSPSAADPISHEMKLVAAAINCLYDSGNRSESERDTLRALVTAISAALYDETRDRDAATAAALRSRWEQMCKHTVVFKAGD